jgi:hypothetical protein
VLGAGQQWLSEDRTGFGDPARALASGSFTASRSVADPGYYRRELQGKASAARTLRTHSDSPARATR